jgi:23S rRNA C2498 (ribose-2'-O)-methylase RlmM
MIPQPATHWLVRLPAVFGSLRQELLATLGLRMVKRLGGEFLLVNATFPQWLGQPAGVFLPWRLPVHHSWPCQPSEVEGFIEKSAQALLAKFQSQAPQAVLCGTWHDGPQQSYFRQMASNLRGRLLTIFGKASGKTAEEQSASAETLYVLVGKEGLYAGLCTPQQANGWHPGGTRFIRQQEGISRAGAKLAEALHYATLWTSLPSAGSSWLELGASPGGMTQELLLRGYSVTAVDRAPLDRRLHGQKRLRFQLADVATYQPAERERFSALLCDLNGDAAAALPMVCRFLPWLEPGALVIFTMKLPGECSVATTSDLLARLLRVASQRGLQSIAQTHLKYNRQEFTLLWRTVPQD